VLQAATFAVVFSVGFWLWTDTGLVKAMVVGALGGVLLGLFVAWDSRRGRGGEGDRGRQQA